MFVSNLKLWNFRKFGGGGPILTAENNFRSPDLDLSFNPGLNLLIGENDSGKSALIDALKLILKTHSTEWIKPGEEDFHGNTDRFRIEVVLKELSDPEAKNFVEWIGMEGTGEAAKPYLRLILDVARTVDKILPSEVKAGVDDKGSQLTAEARELLKVVYLKPLRDAWAELIPRKNSRLSQILKGHEAFKGKEKTHYLKQLFEQTNTQIKKYFEGVKIDNEGKEVELEEQHGKKLNESVNEILKSFFRISDDKSSTFSITGKELANILESLKLILNDEHSGLGSHNLLFIAAELILLKREEWEGLSLGLIEEIEAHLHPQAQIRVMKYLSDLCCKKDPSFQIIVTSHSTTLASGVPLQNTVVVKDGKVHSLKAGETKLTSDDYKFLERFLDATKANMFFARAVLIVEGYAENILLPVIASRLDKDFKKYGVSIVNVGSTAYLRYANIFIDKENKAVNMPVSVITDLDLKPSLYAKALNITAPTTLKKHQIIDGFDEDEIEDFKSNKIIQDDSKTVRTFVSPYWTLEYCFAMCTNLRKPFYKAVLLALKEERRSAGTKGFERLDNKIAAIDSEYENWSQPAEEIAFHIYSNIILKKKISKAIIAQEFAKIAEDEKLDFINDVEPIQYLINAITHVTA